jgi:hypothetical protein
VGELISESAKAGLAVRDRGTVARAAAPIADAINLWTPFGEMSEDPVRVMYIVNQLFAVAIGSAVRESSFKRIWR